MFAQSSSKTRCAVLCAALLLPLRLFSEVSCLKTEDATCKKNYAAELQSQLEKARERFQIAVQENRVSIEVAEELAFALSALNRFDEALAVYNQVLVHDPSSPAVLYDIGVILKLSGRIDAARETFQQAMDQAKYLNAKCRFSHGVSCLTQGKTDTDWLTGWEDYEWRWESVPCPREQFGDKPLWDGSDLQGKTILLIDEQGLGDTMQFIRYAQRLKRGGATVILLCNPVLKTFLQTAADYLDYVITDGDVFPPFDVQMNLLSLPYFFKTVEKTIPVDIPYLKADPELVSFWQKKLSADKYVKIGLCWQGNPKCSTQVTRQIVPARSIVLKQLLSQLSIVPNCSFYSLQKIDGQEQLEELQSANITHFSSDFDDVHGRFMDSAALMMNLDLVITIDTSIAHLAGALGVPVWILLPNPGDWRWMIDRLDTPWYPQARLFRQEQVGDWSQVLTLVAQELQNFVEARRNLSF